MAKRILFDPSDYRELSSEEQALLRLAYQKALEALRRNITPNGFSACSRNTSRYVNRRGSSKHPSGYGNAVFG